MCNSGGGLMRLQFMVLLTLIIILWASTGATAVVENVDGIFEVEYDPAFFVLKPDEDGTLTFNVENVGNETWMVALRFSRMESGYTDADIRPSLLELEANASQRVTITIRTNAKFGQEPGSSDFEITIYWGKNIVVYDWGGVDDDTIEGRRSLRFQVEDDLSEVEALYQNILYIAVLIAVIIGVGMLVWKLRSDGRLKK